MTQEASPRRFNRSKELQNEQYRPAANPNFLLSILDSLKKKKHKILEGNEKIRVRDSNKKP